MKIHVTHWFCSVVDVEHDDPAMIDRVLAKHGALIAEHGTERSSPTSARIVLETPGSPPHELLEALRSAGYRVTARHTEEDFSAATTSGNDTTAWACSWQALGVPLAPAGHRGAGRPWVMPSPATLYTAPSHGEPPASRSGVRQADPS
jgi:hypothetical protein